MDAALDEQRNNFLTDEVEETSQLALKSYIKSLEFFYLRNGDRW